MTRMYWTKLIWILPNTRSLMDYLSARQDGTAILTVYVQPKASRSAVCGVHDNCLKIAVTSPPVDGKANKAVIAFLAKLLNVAKRDVQLHHGQQSRKKQFFIVGKGVEDIRGDLRPVLEKIG